MFPMQCGESVTVPVIALTRMIIDRAQDSSRPCTRCVQSNQRWAAVDPGCQTCASEASLVKAGWSSYTFSMRGVTHNAYDRQGQ